MRSIWVKTLGVMFVSDMSNMLLCFVCTYNICILHFFLETFGPPIGSPSDLSPSDLSARTSTKLDKLLDAAQDFFSKAKKVDAALWVSDYKKKASHLKVPAQDSVAMFWASNMADLKTEEHFDETKVFLDRVLDDNLKAAKLNEIAKKRLETSWKKVYVVDYSTPRRQVVKFSLQPTVYVIM